MTRSCKRTERSDLESKVARRSHGPTRLSTLKYSKVLSDVPARARTDDYLRTKHSQTKERDSEDTVVIHPYGHPQIRWSDLHVLRVPRSCVFPSLSLTVPLYPSDDGTPPTVSLSIWGISTCLFYFLSHKFCKVGPLNEIERP